jgi:GntR family transcriptional regulator, transcriptional repressor for pyruvate dehydrogenase complex
MRGPETVPGGLAERDRESGTVTQDAGALTPLPRTPLYERLVERLRAHVQEVGLQKGERLPAERDLAQRLGVSRASLKQAIVALEVQGLVEVRHGGGTFLRTDDLRPAPLAEVLDRQRRLPDILDAREALEVKLAELAAERRTDDDVAAVFAALELMSRAVEQGDPGVEGDAAFHAAITAAAHSALLARMMAELADDIGESRRESLQQTGRPAGSLSQHRDIAHAVRDMDQVAAGGAMRRHLRSVRDVKLLAWRPTPELG